MMIINSSIGATIGAMVKAAGMPATVRMNDDSIEVTFLAEKDSANVKNEKPGKSEKKKRRSRYDIATANGKSYTLEEWAKREKVTLWTIFYRMDKWGSPVGPKKPTDKDKIVMGL